MNVAPNNALHWTHPLRECSADFGLATVSPETRTTLQVCKCNVRWADVIIGVLEVLAGFGYRTLLWRPLAHYLYPYNLALAGPGEISLMLWLLVKGVDVRKWKETAGAGADAANSAPRRSV
jgi:hypothetical protein